MILKSYCCIKYHMFTCILIHLCFLIIEISILYIHTINIYIYTGYQGQWCWRQFLFSNAAWTQFIHLATAAVAQGLRSSSSTRSWWRQWGGLQFELTMLKTLMLTTIAGQQLQLEPSHPFSYCRRWPGPSPEPCLMLLKAVGSPPIQCWRLVCW